MPSSAPRVRFAPSPTGNVHIGNIRVAIFNWLRARHTGGKFILRVEDTDLERSTPAAVAALLAAMEWLGLDYDEEPLYQSAQADAHRAAAARLVEAGHACRREDGVTVMKIARALFDPSFVTEPREEVSIDLAKGGLRTTPRGFEHVVAGSDGREYVTPYHFDALEAARLELDDGRTLPVPPGAAPETGGARPVRLVFRRRYVFFDDLVMGRLEKPLDSLRDFAVMRSDGSPIFHLANVVDDITQNVTEILRGNDHVENTFRHLFLFRGLGRTPPRYGHFPMIVNNKGKPYSKRDGDAYVGDFRDKGYLPEALFNFLALCGWGRDEGDDIFSRGQLVAAFTLERVGAAPAKMNLEKLEWMNGRHLGMLPAGRLAELVRGELAAAGVEAGGLDGQWLERLVDLERERLKTVKDFVANTRFFFAAPTEYDAKAAEKFLLKNDRAGLKALRGLRGVLAGVPVWNEAGLEAAGDAHAAAAGLKMGDLAQPLRVAITGGGVSRGLWPTLELLGRGQTLARIDRALDHFA